MAYPVDLSIVSVRFGSLADTQKPENFRMAEFGVRTRSRVSAFGQKQTFARLEKPGTWPGFPEFLQLNRWAA